MARLLRVLAGVTGIIVTLFGAVFFIATAGSLHRSSAAFTSDVVTVFVFLAILLGGLWLVHVGWPGSMGRLPRRVFTRDFLYSPAGHAPLAYLAGAALMLVAGKAALLVVLAVAVAYAVGSPALIALRPRWWLNAILSTFAGIVLVVLLPATGEWLTHQRFGDDAMVLLFPIMVFPAALFCSLLLRVFVNRNRARGAM
jgi:hypothetical protein